MSMKENLQEQRNKAMKTMLNADDKDLAKQNLNTIRAILAEITARETFGKQRQELTDNEIINVLRKMVKTRRDSAQLFRDKGVDSARIDREEQEAEYIEQFLPKILSEEETEKEVLRVISENKLKGTGGKGMKEIMSAFAGRTDIDRAVISRIAKAQILP